MGINNNLTSQKQRDLRPQDICDSQDEQELVLQSHNYSPVHGVKLQQTQQGAGYNAHLKGHPNTINVRLKKHALWVTFVVLNMPPKRAGCKLTHIYIYIYLLHNTTYIYIYVCIYIY